jgi:hypothetical protein
MDEPGASTPPRSIVTAGTNPLPPSSAPFNTRTEVPPSQPSTSSWPPATVVGPL